MVFGRKLKLPRPWSDLSSPIDSVIKRLLKEIHQSTRPNELKRDLMLQWQSIPSADTSRCATATIVNASSARLCELADRAAAPTSQAQRRSSSTANILLIGGGLCCSSIHYGLRRCFNISDSIFPLVGIPLREQQMFHNLFKTLGRIISTTAPNIAANSSQYRNHNVPPKRM